MSRKKSRFESNRDGSILPEVEVELQLEQPESSHINDMDPKVSTTFFE